MNGFVYQEIFWLFLVGSVLGVVVEGCWCRFRYGRWRTHVVALWGPFNIVYGIGIAVFYLGESLLQQKAWPVRVAALALAGSLVEYLCGLVIRVGIRMKAWDYRNHFLNIQGLISFKMTLMWGGLGVVFDRLLFRPLKKMLSHITGAAWDLACEVLSVFMVINLSCTAICIIRWANRHRGKPPMNRVSQWIDKNYPDSWMEKRFCNWRFMEPEECAAHQAA